VASEFIYKVVRKHTHTHTNIFKGLDVSDSPMTYLYKSLTLNNVNVAQYRPPLPAGC